MGTGFYGSYDPTNSVKALKEQYVVYIDCWRPVCSRWPKSDVTPASKCLTRIIVASENEMRVCATRRDATCDMHCDTWDFDTRLFDMCHRRASLTQCDIALILLLWRPHYIACRLACSPWSQFQRFMVSFFVMVRHGPMSCVGLMWSYAVQCGN